jgi:hypothetical protein
VSENSKGPDPDRCADCGMYMGCGCPAERARVDAVLAEQACRPALDALRAEAEHWRQAAYIICDNPEGYIALVAERDRYRAALEQVAYGGHQRGCGALASCGCREEVAIAALGITTP